MISTLTETGEVQPAELITVKLWVPVAKPETVVLKVDPAIPPGLIVQLPEGNPLRITLPVAVAQVGWVIVPTEGAEGVIG